MGLKNNKNSARSAILYLYTGTKQCDGWNFKGLVQSFAEWIL